MGILSPRRLASLACAAVVGAGALPAWADPPLAKAAPPAAVAPVPMKSPELVAGGGVLVLAGVVGVTFGVMRVTTLATCPGSCPNPARNEKIGGAVLGVSAGALAAGIVMIVVGTRPAATATAPPVATTLPAWAGAPGGPGWAWRF